MVLLLFFFTLRPPRPLRPLRPLRLPHPLHPLIRLWIFRALHRAPYVFQDVQSPWLQLPGAHCACGFAEVLGHDGEYAIFLDEEYGNFLDEEYGNFLDGEYAIFLDGEYAIFLDEEYGNFLDGEYAIFLVEEYGNFLDGGYAIFLDGEFGNFLDGKRHCVHVSYYDHGDDFDYYENELTLDALDPAYCAFR